jgi:hypothetical protein
LVQGVHLANPTVHSPLVPSGVKETPIVDHNKRPASSDMLDIVECKRLKQEDQSNNSILPLPVNKLVFPESLCMQRQLDNVLVFLLFQL